ncbi:hypothetical protein D3C80_501310 [compost metagenome]
MDVNDDAGILYARVALVFIASKLAPTLFDRRRPNAQHPLWERACSRKRWVSQHLCKLTRRLREQARSHRCVCCRNQALAAIAVTSTRMPSTASEATPTAARTGHGLAK